MSDMTLLPASRRRFLRTTAALGAAAVAGTWVSPGCLCYLAV